MLPTRRLLRICTALALALTVCAPPGFAAPSLEDLLARLAPPNGRFESTYTQTRESSLLTESARTQGRIVYESPGHLRKSEQGPNGERVIEIREGTVEIRGPDETRRFPVSRARPLEQLMRLLEALATGDAEALREHFKVEFDGGDDPWTLMLEDPGTHRRPGQPSMHDDPLRIVVEGGASVERIELQPPQGQTTILELGTDS
ncbi:MAG: LolA-related protein [Halofilum sp. (in: g-proteobacteria)]